MNTVHIGSGSEYVKITLNPPCSTEGSCQTCVEIAVSGFHGLIEPWIEVFDIESFASQLMALYESLQGEARLVPREEQFTLIAQAGTGGHIRISGTAYSKATYGNKLEFCLELDQSYLPQVLAQLGAVVRKET